MNRIHYLAFLQEANIYVRIKSFYASIGIVKTDPFSLKEDNQQNINSKVMINTELALDSI